MADKGGLGEFYDPALYPSTAEATLRHHYVGKQLDQIQAPAAIVDLAVARRNCSLMLDATKKLGLDFRAHVKTHKTVQLAKLQVGVDSVDIRFVVSTVAEVENLQPWLSECKTQGKSVNVIYGIPLAPSNIPRLAAVARTLGEGSISLLVDHADHVKILDAVDPSIWPGKISVLPKIDTGYQRAGVAVDSKQLSDLAYAIGASNQLTVAGFYTHMGHSYGVGSPKEALEFLTKEIQGLEEGAVSFLKCAGASISAIADASSKLVLTVGASPTATAAQNALDDSEEAKSFRALIQRLNQSFAVELHAGVYPLMDMQQLATRARPRVSSTAPDQTLLSFANLGLRVLVEVVSVYEDRGKPEVLIAAGTIVLGREPCKSYPGWGVVTAWPESSGQTYDPEGSKTGWIVGRISQEHGILTWEGPRDQLRPLKIGQKLLLWPNHACMVGTPFASYAVVDSETDDPNKVVDVWARWRGW